MKMKTIDIKKYNEDLEKISEYIYNNYFIFKPDAIVCLKRSGFIIGAYLSNKLTIPLFTSSEISSIPTSFKNILIVDDKIQTGKSINKVINKLNKDEINIKTCVLYMQGQAMADYYINYFGERVKMWYEN